MDDEPVVLTSLRDQLYRHFKKKYEIELAENGKDAFAIVNELSELNIEIPVIITDQIMPAINLNPE